MGMREQLLQTIRRRRLIPPGAHVVVGVSGGADSVALLAALHSLRPALPFGLTAAHLHHGLRGKAADEDAEFVQLLAWRLGVPCHIERVDVASLARREGVSVEMAGRKARYEFLLRVARCEGAGRVATAHHADDQVETLLLRLLRGSGLRGLGGMAYERPMGELRLIRPLLDVRHQDLVAFLEAHGLAWREDASNKDSELLRNRVRLELIPFLEQRFEPAIREILRRSAAVLREDQRWLETLAQRAYRRCRVADGGLNRARWGRLPLAVRRRVLLEWLRDAGLPEARLGSELVERVDRWDASSATRLALPGRKLLEKRAGRLVMRAPAPRASSVAPVIVQVPGRAAWPAMGWQIVTRRSRGFTRGRPEHPRQRVYTATLNEALLQGDPLMVRARRPGDRMAPWGLSGTVKLQDVLVNMKVPAEQRARWPVVTCRNEVVWMPGYRMARAWAVPSATAPSFSVRISSL